MTEEEWTNPTVRCIVALFDGKFAPVDGRPSPSVLLLFNASDEAVTFTLPEAAGIAQWRVRVDTGQGHFAQHEAEAVQPQAQIELESHAMAVLVEGQPA
jgi:glycogen operon protein